MRRSVQYKTSSTYNTIANTPKSSSNNYNFNNYSSKNSSKDFGRKQLNKDPYIGKSAEMKKSKDSYDYDYDEDSYAY